MNHWIGIGRVCTEPVYMKNKYSDAEMARFCMAMQGKRNVQYVDVLVTVNDFKPFKDNWVHKGTILCVQGEINARKKQYKGVRYPVYNYYIYADQVEVLSSREDNLRFAEQAMQEQLQKDAEAYMKKKQEIGSSIWDARDDEADMPFDDSDVFGWDERNYD